jgi:hypothetical protein
MKNILSILILFTSITFYGRNLEYKDYSKITSNSYEKEYFNSSGYMMSKKSYRNNKNQYTGINKGSAGYLKAAMFLTVGIGVVDGILFLTQTINPKEYVYQNGKKGIEDSKVEFPLALNIGAAIGVGTLITLHFTLE